MLGTQQVRRYRLEMRYTDRVVLKAIISLQERSTAPLSWQDIAKEADCHRNTVGKSVNRLKRAGRLHFDYHRGKPTRYCIVENI
jgi:Mn-dependent DtxR family transcriptional regulator